MLGALPTEVLARALAGLEARELLRLASSCRYLWSGSPGAPMGPVEEALRARAAARGLRVADSTLLPRGATSWMAHLAWLEERARFLRHTPLSMSSLHCVLVDAAGRLHTRSELAEYRGSGVLRGHARPLPGPPGGVEYLDVAQLAPDRRPPVHMRFDSFQPVPSMQGVRVLSVAASDAHTLALGAGGEVYSWGFGIYGVLGHGDELPRWTPCRIASLARVESIRATNAKSAAVDEHGRLFTWGEAFAPDTWSSAPRPTGLGHPLEGCTPSGYWSDILVSLTPRVVVDLAAERVVGVALGTSRMLAVVDGGAVFSCGRLDRGSDAEPRAGLRRVEPLAATGLQFVAVAVGYAYNYALAATGELLCVDECDRPVKVLEGVKLVVASACSEGGYAVTHDGSAYSWGVGPDDASLGWRRRTEQPAPTLVHAFRALSVTALAMAHEAALVVDKAGGTHCTGLPPILGAIDSLHCMRA